MGECRPGRWSGSWAPPGASLAALVAATLLLATLVVAAPAAMAQAPATAPPPAPLILRGVNVVDGVMAQPRMGVSILIEGGRIRRIGPADLPASEGTREIRLDGYWVVPGLVDAHSHMNSLPAARRALESGVTTVRTAGVGGFADVAIRDAVRAGWLPGPDVLATGIYVANTVPAMLLGTVAGVWADRWPKRTVSRTRRILNGCWLDDWRSWVRRANSPCRTVG